MTTILVDTKEPPAIWAAIKKEFPEARQASLGTDCGDLFAQLENGAMIVERKDVPGDLTASIADGRLFRQSEHIPRLARFPFLMLDGDLRYSSDGEFVMSARPGIGWAVTGWRRESVEAALIKAEMLGMIVIRNYESYAEGVKRLIALCERADAPHVNRGKARSQNPFDDGTQAKVDFLASLPGVGAERAANLVERFPTESLIGLLEWICNQSDLEQANKVALWGTGTKERVREFLGLRVSQRLKVEARAEWKETV